MHIAYLPIAVHYAFISKIMQQSYQDTKTDCSKLEIK